MKALSIGLLLVGGCMLVSCDVSSSGLGLTKSDPSYYSDVTIDAFMVRCLDNVSPSICACAIGALRVKFDDKALSAALRDATPIDIFAASELASCAAKPADTKLTSGIAAAPEASASQALGAVSPASQPEQSLSPITPQEAPASKLEPCIQAKLAEAITQGVESVPIDQFDRMRIECGG